MEERLVQFIAHLRAAGVRISLAESQDAGRALAQLPQLEVVWVRDALRTTLIKEQSDEPLFEELFELYFLTLASPFLRPNQRLNPEQQELVDQALAELPAEAARGLAQLLRSNVPNPEQLVRLAHQSRAKPMWGPRPESRLTRAMLADLGLARLDKPLETLLTRLEQLGMSPAGQRAVQTLANANQQTLAQQAGQVLRYTAGRPASGQSSRLADQNLLQRSFATLSETEAAELRQQVRRLGVKLRSRAALRQKKGAGKILDARSTLRANLRTAGVPFQLHFKKRRPKPKFVLMCDLSTSMRPVAEFMLRLMYAMQDQIARVRSFAFNDRLEEVSDEFVGRRPDAAIPRILKRMPPGHWATDLGQSLADFWDRHPEAVDRHTTVIVLGDGRNNGRAPRLDLFERLSRRAGRLVWFNPEPRQQWGSGDSDLPRYAPWCTSVRQVSNLAQLTEAVDSLFDPRR